MDRFDRTPRISQKAAIGPKAMDRIISPPCSFPGTLSPRTGGSEARARDALSPARRRNDEESKERDGDD